MRSQFGVFFVTVGLVLTGCGTESEESADRVVTPTTVAECLDETEIQIDRAESSDESEPQANLIGYYPYPSEKHRVVISFYRSERMTRLVQDPWFDKEYGFVSRISETPTASVSYSDDLPAEAITELETCVDLPAQSESLASSSDDGSVSDEGGSAKADLTAADLLVGPEMAWSSLDGEARAAVIEEFMANFGHRFPRVTSGAALLSQAEDSESSGSFATIDTGQTLQKGLKFMAQLVESNEIFKAKSRYLPTKEVLGMTSAEVEQTLGRPDRDQDISGVGVIWYYDLKDNVFQLVFTNDVVTTVNKY